MAETRSLAVGISYLGYAEPGDGIAGTEFTQCPIIEQGTVVFNFNDPTTVNFFAEGMNDPWESFDKLGDADSFDFGIPSPMASEMKTFRGGNATGEKWEAPVEMPIIRKSIKLVTLPYKGKQTEYIFSLCKVFGKIGRAPGAEQTDQMLVRCTKLTPVSSAGKAGSPYSREVKAVTSEP